MRADCKIDNKVVIARNATLLGFATRKIKAGTYFVYRENYMDGSHSTRMARSLGRVSAPALPGPNPTPAIKGYVLAMVWGDMGHAYERWINPADITEAYDKPPTKIAAFFFADKLPYDAQMIRRLMSYGTTSERFIDNAPHHVAAWKQGVSPAAARAGVTGHDDQD